MAGEIDSAAMALWIYDNCPEFYEAWANMRGYKQPTSPAASLVDEATGYTEVMMKQFIEDVGDLVIDRMPPDCFKRLTTPPAGRK